jgi:hypothetical protein
MTTPSCWLPGLCRKFSVPQHTAACPIFGQPSPSAHTVFSEKLVVTHLVKHGHKIPPLAPVQSTPLPCNFCLSTKTLYVSLCCVLHSPPTSCSFITQFSPSSCCLLGSRCSPQLPVLRHNCLSPSVPVRGPLLLFLPPNPKLKDHRFSAVRDIFATCLEVAVCASEAVYH